VVFRSGKVTYLKLIISEMYSANRCPNNSWTCVLSHKTREAGGYILSCVSHARQRSEEHKYVLHGCGNKSFSSSV